MASLGIKLSHNDVTRKVAVDAGICEVLEDFKNFVAGTLSIEQDDFHIQWKDSTDTITVGSDEELKEAIRTLSNDLQFFIERKRILNTPDNGILFQTTTAQWINYISTVDLLKLDSRIDLVPRSTIKYIGPCSPEPFPRWLKCTLPLRSVQLRHMSVVDLALPVDSNPFYRAMNKDFKRQLVQLSSEQSHAFVVGCSGCGKTSACLALAREKYSIYLEVPDELAVANVKRGFRMHPDVWCTNSHFLRTNDDVKGALYVEIAARLVVLHNLLESKDVGSALTPLSWLLFTMSEEGSTRIGDICDALLERKTAISSTVLQKLLGKVNKLISGHVGSEQNLVLIVDELQLLDNRTVADEKNAPMPLITATIEAACNIAMPVVWSGVRIRDMSALSDALAFAGRPFIVAGQYQYLDQEEVAKLLGEVLVLDGVPSAVVAEISYGLQGRARICAGFVSHLLMPDSEFLRPGTVLDAHNIMSAYSTFMEKAVVTRVYRYLQMFKLSHRYPLNAEALGYLYCRTMLCDVECLGGLVDTLTGTAFTVKVEKVKSDGERGERLGVKNEAQSTDPIVSDWNPDLTVGGSQVKEVRYEFEYKYGEPSLQEALLQYARAHHDVADGGVCSVLQSALTASALRQSVGLAVVLSLLYKGEFVLHDLVKGTAFEEFSSYCLNLKRVVYTSKAEDMLEWFTRVIENPDDCQFSKLPGVPVKNIVILPSEYSGTDAICVATLGSPSEREPPAKIARTEKTPPPLVFVHLCCASYEGGATAAKHEDPLENSGDHFAQNNRTFVAAQRYRNIAAKFADLSKVIPVIVQIPENTTLNRDDAEVVIVTENNKGVLLLSPAAIDVLCSPRGSFTQAGVKCG